MSVYVLNSEGVDIVTKFALDEDEVYRLPLILLLEDKVELLLEDGGNLIPLLEDEAQRQKC